jgi:type II secretory pathway component PulM
MMRYWHDRTPRERLLISVAAGLAALMILVQLIWLPAMRTKQSAQRGAEQAARTLEAISRQSVGRPAAGAPATTPADPDNLRRIILEAASTRGLTIVRVLVDAQGAVAVQLDDAPASTVFSWLLDIRRSSGAEISRASMNDSANGFVRSSFEFSGTQG